MRKIHLTESQFKKICKLIKEEGYAIDYTIGTFPTAEEAYNVLDFIRKKFKFSEFNSEVKGTSVIVEIEKSTIDDEYFMDMLNQVKEFSQKLNQKLVAESK